MKDQCVACNIQVHKKQIKHCNKCGVLTCPTCNTNGYCSACHPHNQDNIMIYDYFKDKYLEKARGKITSIMFVLLLFLVLMPSANAIINLGSDNTTRQDDHTIPDPAAIIGISCVNFTSNETINVDNVKMYVDYNFDELTFHGEFFTNDIANDRPNKAGKLGGNSDTAYVDCSDCVAQINWTTNKPTLSTGIKYWVCINVTAPIAANYHIRLGEGDDVSLSYHWRSTSNWSDWVTNKVSKGVHLNITGQDSTLTSLSIGLLNESLDLKSNSSDEDENTYFFANYSYDINSSSVSPDAWCNYTTLNVFDEKHDSNPGTNLSVCGSGCDTNNHTVIFSDLPTNNYIKDIYRTRLCRDTVIINEQVTFSNNCTGSYTVPYSTFPECDNTYLNYSLTDANCTGDISFSVWTSASTSNKEILLVDTFLEVDRLHDDINTNLTFNSTSNLFVSEAREWYTHGTKTVFVDCYTTLSGITNQTGSSISVIVVNAAPFLFIDVIWDAISGSSVFTSGVSKKYPLTNTINVSGGCSDDDLSSAYVNLSFANGSLIYEQAFSVSEGSIPLSVNFTQGNFSVEDDYLNGDDLYTFGAYCNDTLNNITYASNTFSAKNDLPTATWDDGSTLLISDVQDLNFSCVDGEGQTVTSYVSVNGTLNETGSNLTGWNFAYGLGMYEVNLTCFDGLRNSTEVSIMVTFSNKCLIMLTSPCKSCRYRDITVPLSFSCGAGTLDSCSYQIDDYEAVYPGNCSATINITAELGRNHFVLWVNTTAGVEETLTYDFYAKKLSGVTFADYSLLIITFLLICAFLFLRGITGVAMFSIMAALGMLFLGVELWAFDYWLGIFAAGSGVVFLVWTIYDGLSS